MYNSNMKVLKKQKDEKIIKKILKNHFEEFKLKYWNKVRREMREQIENTVIKALNCGKDMILWEIWHYKYGLIYNALDKSNYKRIIYEEIIEKEISLNTTTQIELF